MKGILVPILVLVVAVSALAQSEEQVTKQTAIAKQSVTATGDRGLYTVPSVETLNKGQFSFGLGWNNFDRTPRDIDINTFPLHFSYGVTGRWTITGTLEAQRQVTMRNLPQSGFNSEVPFAKEPFGRGFGDTMLAVKYRLQRRRDNVSGISVGGFVKFGTADAQKGLGTSATDAGIHFIFTSLLPMKFMLHSAMGFTGTSDATEPFSVGVKDQIRSGLGFAWPSSGLDLNLPHTKGSLQGVFEYSTASFVGAGSQNAATTTTQNPSDIAAGIRYLILDRGITLDAGYRRNIKFDFTFPDNTNDHGWTFGLYYTKPGQIQSARNQYPVVALESDSLTISSGGIATITATGFDADNDELAYAWSCTGGKIAGSGEKVTFDTSNVVPGTYLVKATATDGKGGVATSQIYITVR